MIAVDSIISVTAWTNEWEAYIDPRQAKTKSQRKKRKKKKNENGRPKSICKP